MHTNYISYGNAILLSDWLKMSTASSKDTELDKSLSIEIIAKSVKRCSLIVDLK